MMHLAAAPEDLRRIVVLTGGGLGDTVLARPALAALRRTHPRAQILVAGPSRYAPLVSDCVDEVLLVDTDSTAGLAALAHTPGAESPDLAVHLLGSSPQGHLALAMLRPRALAAFRSAPVHVSGPAWKDREHDSDRWSRLLASELNIPVRDTDRFLPESLLAGTRRHGAVIVHAVGDSPGTTWPLASYARACRRLAERGYRVLLIGTAAQRQSVDHVGAWGAVPLEDRLAGRTGIASLTRLIAGASLVLTGSAGVGQLADAVGVPTVTLLNGPSDRAPRGPGHTVLRSQRLDHLDLTKVITACLSRLDSPIDMRRQLARTAT